VALATCTFCGQEVDPGGRGVYRRVRGWERKRDQGGANVIHLREELDEFACSSCVDRLKRGIPARQGALL